MATFRMTVDGKRVSVNAEPEMPLLYALRNDLGLNNPHFGCGLAQCGACTVHLDGEPVRSCVLPVSAASGKRVTTIKGLGTPKKPHPLQAAYVEETLLSVLNQHYPDLEYIVVDGASADGAAEILRRYEAPTYT